MAYKATDMKTVETDQLQREVVDNIHRIIATTLDIRDTYTSIVAELKRAVDFDRASISLLGEKKDMAITYVMSTDYDNVVLKEGGPYPLKGSLLEKTTTTGEPVIVEDTESKEISTNILLLREGIRSRLGVPLKVKGKVIGNINLGSKRPNNFSTAHINLLEQVSPQLAMATENTILFRNIKRSEEILRQEKNKLQYVVDALDIGICLMDRELNITWANKKLSEIWGLPGSAVGTSCRGIFQCEEIICPAKEAFERGKSRFHDIKVLVKEGRRRYIENIGIPMRDDKGDVGRVLLLSMDITDREKRIHQLSLLTQLSDALQYTLKLDKVFQLVLTCVTAGHALGFNRAMLFLMNQEQGAVCGKMAIGPSDMGEAHNVWQEISKHQTLEGLLKDVVELGPLDTQLSIKTKLMAFPISNEDEIVIRCLKEKVPLVVKDADHDPRVTREFRNAIGAKEFVCVPLMVKGRAIGVIVADNLYSGEPITEEHVSILNTFAESAALAIENAETYKKLEDKMRQLTETQEKLLRSERLVAMGEIASYVAHEIRNPLVTIGGFARSIERLSTENEKIHTSSKIIVQEVKRLEKILDNIREFSKPAEPRKTEVHINNLMEDTLALTERYLGEMGITVHKELGHNLPEALVDPAQMKQVFLNLIKNAVESMPEGGTLTVKTCVEDNSIKIDFADTGEGIPPEVIGKLFTPFFTTKTAGTGVGLAVSHKIIDDHEGTLSVSSAAGRGSVFSILLPTRDAKEDLKKGGGQ
ncbi:MAG: GAF domain-containing protein [Candidatus Brocadiales bacterium]